MVAHEAEEAVPEAARVGHSVATPAVVGRHLQAVARDVAREVLEVEEVALRPSRPVVTDAAATLALTWPSNQNSTTLIRSTTHFDSPCTRHDVNYCSTTKKGLDGSHGHTSLTTKRAGPVI